MNTTSGIEMLTLSSEGPGSSREVHPTLIWDPNAMVLVDAGYPGQIQIIRAAIQQTGLPFERLNTVIITHHDIDHIGSLGDLQKALPQLKTLAYGEEKAYIEGTKRPLKLAQMEDNLENLPETMKAFYPKFKAGFENSFTQVDAGLTDGEELPYGGGIRVIFTPGHTLGHICLYAQATKTLVAGDALKVEAGELCATPESINYDAGLYKQSLQKLASYDIEKIICYHGGFYAGPANQRIAELAAV